MNSIYADVKKNRLYLTLDTIFDEDIFIMIEGLIAEVSKLNQNFTCLVDIRNLHLSMTEKDETYVEVIQMALKLLGMGRVVRVIGPGFLRNYTHNKMNALSREAGYRATAVETFQDAEKLLDSFIT